eukprot:g28600.t1
MFSWYSRDFISKSLRQQHAAASDADAKVTIDQWIQWPFQCGADDAWKFFMRMNEASLRATLVAKTSFERFCDQPAQVLTMLGSPIGRTRPILNSCRPFPDSLRTHFLTRPELPFDWTIPGIWDHIGCEGLDEQVRTIGSDCHVYGRACMGQQVREIEGRGHRGVAGRQADGVYAPKTERSWRVPFWVNEWVKGGLSYVHNYIGTTDQHRPGMAPFCIFDKGAVLPAEQPTQEKGFNFQPLQRPEEPRPETEFPEFPMPLRSRRQRAGRGVWSVTAKSWAVEILEKL